MRHQQTQSARQYARPGCCYEKPVVIDDDNQMAPQKTITKPISAHTATWLEAKASGRWQAPTSTKTNVTFANTAMSLEENPAGKWHGSVDRPAAQAEPAPRCRKRALPDAVEDNDRTNDGSKRLRMSGMGFAGEKGGLNQHQRISQMEFRASHANNHSIFTPTGEESPANDLAEIEAGLRTMQRNIDLEHATMRDIQRAEQQVKYQEKERPARGDEMRDQGYRSTFQSSLQKMWQDCDRGRLAAEERRNTREREEIEEAKRKEWEAERKKLNELSTMESNLRKMWEVEDLARGVPPKIRPGQLSEVGQRRVRKRVERLRRQK